MKDKKFTDIKGIIWDLDNTLYRVDEAIYHAFNIAVARAVIASGVDIKLSEATKMGQDSFIKHGFSGQVFIDEYNLDHEKLHLDLHDHIDETIIKSSQRTIELFQKIALNHVLVTHGSGDWAQRVLDHLGIKKFFPDGHIFPFERYGFQKKSECGEIFKISGKYLNTNNQNIVVIEDTVENLRIPSEMGMMTVLIHHGSKASKAPDFVNYSCNNVVDILEKIISDKRSAH
jgi:putative hydrolase of the HAD superfamily